MQKGAMIDSDKSNLNENQERDRNWTVRHSRVQSGFEEDALRMKKENLLKDKPKKKKNPSPISGESAIFADNFSKAEANCQLLTCLWISKWLLILDITA